MTDHTLTALAALHALHDVRRWLLEAPTVEAQPGRRRTAAPRELTTRTAGRVDRLLRTERAERTVTDIPTTPPAVPVRPAILDAQQAVQDAAVDAAWIVASGLRRRQLVVLHHQARLVWRDSWAAAVLQLRVGIPCLVCDCAHDSRFANHGHRGGCLDAVAEQVAAILGGADERARLVLGMGPSWVALAIACDQCDRRTVEAEVSSTDERDWIARCRNGCWIARVENHPKAALADSAVLRSIRRQYAAQRRRERIAA
jgi:hypothetical protein